MSDILIPMARDPGHDMQDDCADWAVSNVRPFVPQGCDQQGRYVPTYPAEACTEVGAEPDKPSDYSRLGTAVLIVVIYTLSALLAVQGVLFVAKTLAEAAP